MAFASRFQTCCCCTWALSFAISGIDFDQTNVMNCTCIMNLSFANNCVFLTKAQLHLIEKRPHLIYPWAFMDASWMLPYLISCYLTSSHHACYLSRPGIYLYSFCISIWRWWIERSSQHIVYPEATIPHVDAASFWVLHSRVLVLVLAINLPGLVSPRLWLRVYSLSRAQSVQPLKRWRVTLVRLVRRDSCKSYSGKTCKTWRAGQGGAFAGFTHVLVKAWQRSRGPGARAPYWSRGSWVALLARLWWSPGRSWASSTAPVSCHHY